MNECLKYEILKNIKSKSKPSHKDYNLEDTEFAILLKELQLDGYIKGFSFHNFNENGTIGLRFTISPAISGLTQKGINEIERLKNLEID